MRCCCCASWTPPPQLHVGSVAPLPERHCAMVNRECRPKRGNRWVDSLALHFVPRSARRRCHRDVCASHRVATGAPRRSSTSEARLFILERYVPPPRLSSCSCVGFPWSARVRDRYCPAMPLQSGLDALLRRRRAAASHRHSRVRHEREDRGLMRSALDDFAPRCARRDVDRERQRRSRAACDRFLGVTEPSDDHASQLRSRRSRCEQHVRDTDRSRSRRPADRAIVRSRGFTITWTVGAPDAGSP